MMKQKKVFDLFQIKLITFYISIVLFVPNCITISYIINLQNQITIDRIIIYSCIFDFIYLVIGFIYYYANKFSLKRQLKTSYPKEFMFVITISISALFGIAALFVYLQGDLTHALHIILPIFIILSTIIFLVGDRYYNIRFL